MVPRAEVIGVTARESTAATAPETASPRFPRAVSFVVPALNEEKNIEDSVREIHRAAEGLDGYEIVVVDDGSTDRTGEIADELARRDGRIRVVHNQRNVGFGGAYKIGVKHASQPYVIMIPGDNNHPAWGITPILSRIGEADMVIPYVTNLEIRGRKRQLISVTYTRLLNFLFRLDVPYFNGLVLHRTDLLRGITIETNGYAYQSEALIKLIRRGATSVTVPVSLAHDDQFSRAFKLKNILRVGETILRLLFSR